MNRSGPQQGVSAPHHKLLAATEKSLRAAEVDNGLVAAEGQCAFDVAIGPDSIDRALGILAQLLSTAADAGFQVRIEPNSGHTIAIVEEEDLQIRLREITRRSDHEDTAEETAKYRSERAKGRFFFPPRWDYTPQGTLVLSVEDHVR